MSLPFGIHSSGQAVMYLPVSVLLLSALLGHASALKCYSCSKSKCDPVRDVQICKKGELCMTRIDQQTHVMKTISKSCATSNTCLNISLNLGTIITDIRCCDRDLCNIDSAKEKKSELQCLGCLQLGSDFKCNKTGIVECKETQTSCGRLNTLFPEGGRRIDFQGCVSESVCNMNSTSLIFEIELGKSFECCDRNLCNGASQIATGALSLVSLCLYFLVTHSN